MSLRKYKEKRDFKATPEPRGKKLTSDHELIFVIQKHAASHLHYDLRLEMHGVLKSWAVPKGPSLDPSVKHLAIEVEDHPLEYGGFEGVIPKGQYGGGAVMVWDGGVWECEGDPIKAYQKGDITFHLYGKKLHGAWKLIRIKGKANDDKTNWLLFKLKDKYASKTKNIIEAKPLSILTKRSIQKIAEEDG